MQKEMLVSSHGLWWQNALEMCSITGSSDLPERQAHEASRCSLRRHVMHVRQICQSVRGGGSGGLHCIP